MIPTFFGVSLAIWLVMTAAPGRPTSGASPSSEAGQDGAAQGDRAGQNESERIFRHQFGLNRPRFWNNWVGLEKEDVKFLVQVLVEGPEKHGIKEVTKAKQALEDFDRYAVKPLLELLQETEGDEQTKVRSWLQASAYQYPEERESGHVRTQAEIEQDRALTAENARIKSKEMRWGKDATKADREQVVANWKQWWEEKKGTERFTYLEDGWERFWLRAGDTQFGKYWGNLLTFNFGKSHKDKKPVLDVIFSKLKYSLSLAVPSFLIAWILAVFLGVLGAAKHNTPFDQGSAVVLFMLYSIPSFLMATILQKGFAIDNQIWPTTGWESTDAHNMNTWDQFKDVLYHLVLPLICYTYTSLAFISRQARSGMLEVLQSDYIRTAYAKGCSRKQVIWRHAFRNGMMPLITLLGTALPVLLGGSVVIEVIFDIPGFGKAMLDAILSKDYNMVMGIALLTSALTLVGLLIADILYAAVDPRVSYE